MPLVFRSAKSRIRGARFTPDLETENFSKSFLAKTFSKFFFAKPLIVNNNRVSGIIRVLRGQAGFRVRAKGLIYWEKSTSFLQVLFAKNLANFFLQSPLSVKTNVFIARMHE